MKLKQLNDLFVALQRCNHVKDYDFGLAVLDTMMEIRNRALAFQASCQPPASLIAFNEKRNAELRRCCQKDEKGTPVMQDLGNGMQVFAMGPEWEEAKTALLAEFPDAEEILIAHDKEVASLVEREEEVKLRSIKLSQVPKDKAERPSVADLMLFIDTGFVVRDEAEAEKKA